MLAKQFIAVTGGSVAGHPLDKRTWSGLSYSFFSELHRRGGLHRAFTVEPKRLPKLLYMLRNVHVDRKRWRKQFYMDPGYRHSLTAALRREMRTTDFEHDFVQIGAMFNSAEASGGKTRSFSYSDSSVAEAIRSPYAPKGLGARRIDRVIAYEKQIYHGMARVFTCGNYLRESLIKDYDLPPERVVAIGAGVVLDEFPEVGAPKRYDTQEILILGADFRRKGGWELLRALRIVRQKYPETQLHIVGPSTLKIPTDLMGGVVFHGYLDKAKPDDWERLKYIFSRCSLFALPSLYEPFGVAPLEAMAHQIPCVVSNIGALGETVTPGKTGALVDPGSVEDLAETLSGLLSDPNKLQQMGQAGRESVREWYTWDRVVDRFVRSTGDA
jgi:glycosyltransferase involved in cell wall biosynthesis